MRISQLARLVAAVLLAPLSSHAAPAPDLPSAASFYVKSLPDLHEDPHSARLKIFAGHISSDPLAKAAAPTDVTAHLYFVMIKNRRAADRERVMFWFNGGPGCSSFDGLMMENGPWRFGEDKRLYAQDGGWEEYVTMVYVDQPAGTGYSYTSTNHYVHTLSEAAVQVVEFIKNFYQIFPEYRNADTYLGGESYAGQYIPYFADEILNKGPDPPIQLKGVAIGNGWMDARSQYPAYLPYAVKQGLLVENTEPWKKAKKATEDCEKVLKAHTSGIEPINESKCEDIMNIIMFNDKTKGPKGEEMCVNMYDTRLRDTSPACGMNWPPEIKTVTSYLGRSDVVRALNANAHPGAWQECGGPVRQNFHERKSNSSILLLPSVIERVPVLIFAGDQDLICNYVGLEAMMQGMEWAGGKGFGTVETQSWVVNGTAAGTWVTSRNLTYAKVFNASHMAPYDVPHVGHDMILRFMGMNFSAILDGSARIPSSVGDDSKPLLLDTNQTHPLPNTPPAGPSSADEEKAAALDKYSNTGTSAIVLLIILTLIGLFLYWRYKKRPGKAGVQLSQSAREEEIPLTGTNGYGEDRGRSRPSRKGKERALEREDDDDDGSRRGSREELFNVGSDSEDEEPKRQ